MIDDEEYYNYTVSTETPEDIEIVKHRGGFAMIDETEVSTASPTIIYDNNSPHPPIDFDNRHERRKKAALARKKRNNRK